MGIQKYVIIAPEETRREEKLIDLSKDPGEMKNLAADPAYRSQLENARQGLRQWYGANGFALDSKYQVKPESAN
jgi:choline-sulfatase